MKTILVLNDNESDIDNLLDILDRHYDVLISMEIQESIELIENEPLDLFLLSLDLEDHEKITDLKNLLKAKNIPTIFSKSSGKEEKEEAVIIKSFDAFELIKKIKKIL